MAKAVILIFVLVLVLNWTLQDVGTVEFSVAPAELDSASDEETIGNATEFNPREACAAAPEPGPCKGLLQRHFYNSTSMSCQMFSYHGCGGNQNNFKTKKRCLEGCHPDETCTAAPVTGRCKARIPRYFYNSTSMSCEVFIYGGCGGNQNNFKTASACVERCHSKEVCTAAPETGPCKARKLRYFYNSTSMSCEVFTYGGCRGNQNNFKTEKGCLERCHSKETCTAAPVTGRCKAHIPRYFYNSTSMSCEVFIYGGCGGNQNNFKTNKQCLKRCHPEEVCTAAPETGPCKAHKLQYFYNSTSMSCDSFIYGGCRGNLNNFKTAKQCMKRCHIKAN